MQVFVKKGIVIVYRSKVNKYFIILSKK